VVFIRIRTEKNYRLFQTARTIAFIVNRESRSIKEVGFGKKSFLCRALVKVVKKGKWASSEQEQCWALWSLTGTNEEEHSTLRTRLANQSQSGQLLLNGSPIEPSVLQNLTSGPPLKLPGLVPNQPFIQHCYNLRTHSSTGRSAFSVCYGFQPMDLVADGSDDGCVLNPVSGTSPIS